MKQKYVAPLAVVFVILLALVVFKQMNKPTYEITEQVKLTSLVPEGLTKADIAKIELYSGGNAEEKLTLERSDADAGVWWITSHFNAPANTEKIDTFLETALSLEGEPRDKNAGDASLESYSLKDDMAFHVKGYKNDETTAAFDVLVGKAPAPDQVFMRASGSNDVYLLGANLKSEAGVFQDDAAAKPGADAWLKKEVVNIAKDTISKVVVTTPDKRIAIAKETKEVPVEPATPAESGEADAEKTEDAATPPQTRTETTWKLVEGGAGLEVKQSGVENLAGAFAPLNASDVVDPAKLADWGLETPRFTCAITVDGKEGDVVIEGGRVDPNGDGYVRVASANKDVIYKLSKFTFEKIFPKGTDMFTLKGLALDKAQISRIDLTQPSGNISLAKSGEEWTISTPTADLDPQRSTIDAVANVLSAWTPSDYADSAEGAALEAPTHTAVVTLASGEQHTLALGAPSKGIAGQYARLDNGASVLVMSKGDIDRAFPAPKDIYQRQVLSILEDEITSIAIERAADPIQLARTDAGAWTLTANGAVVEPLEENCAALAAAIVDFEASDIVFGQADLAEEPIATVTVTMKDGATHVLRFGKPDEKGVSAVAVSGKGQIFRAEKLTVDEILVGSASLKAPEPAPAPADMPDAGPAAPENAPDATPMPEQTESTESATPNADVPVAPEITERAPDASPDTPAPAPAPEIESTPPPAPVQESAPAPAVP